MALQPRTSIRMRSLTPTQRRELTSRPASHTIKVAFTSRRTSYGEIANARDILMKAGDARGFAQWRSCKGNNVLSCRPLLLSRRAAQHPIDKATVSNGAASCLSDDAARGEKFDS
jgi:hypothetical protein